MLTIGWQLFQALNDTTVSLHEAPALRELTVHEQINTSDGNHYSKEIKKVGDQVREGC